MFQALLQLHTKFIKKRTDSKGYMEEQTLVRTYIIF